MNNKMTVNEELELVRAIKSYKKQKNNELK